MFLLTLKLYENSKSRSLILNVNRIILICKLESNQIITKNFIVRNSKHSDGYHCADANLLPSCVVEASEMHVCCLQAVQFCQVEVGHVVAPILWWHVLICVDDDEKKSRCVETSRRKTVFLERNNQSRNFDRQRNQEVNMENKFILLEENYSPFVYMMCALSLSYLTSFIFIERNCVSHFQQSHAPEHFQMFNCVVFWKKQHCPTNFTTFLC